MQVLLLTCLLCLCVSDCPVHKVIMFSLNAGQFLKQHVTIVPSVNTQPKVDSCTTWTWKDIYERYDDIVFSS